MGSNVTKQEASEDIQDVKKEFGTSFLFDGSGDSGKSSLYKLITKNNISKDSIPFYRESIYKNILHTINSLCLCGIKKEFKFSEDEKKVIDEFIKLVEEDPFFIKLVSDNKFSDDLYSKVKYIWSIPLIQSALELYQYEYHIFDNAK